MPQVDRDDAEETSVTSGHKRASSAAFDQWALKKSCYDRGLLLLSSVSTSRLTDSNDSVTFGGEPEGNAAEETYKKLVVAMVCIDCVLGKLHKPAKDDSTMKKVFYGWCVNKFTYRNIELLQREYDGEFHLPAHRVIAVD